MSSSCDLSRGIAQVRRRALPKYQPIMALYGASYSPTRSTKYDYSGKDHVQVSSCLPDEVTHWLILDFIVSDRKGQNAMNLNIPSSSSSSSSQVLGHCAHASTPWPSPAAGRRRVIFPTLHDDSDARVSLMTTSNENILSPVLHHRAPSLDACDQVVMDSMISISPSKKDTVSSSIKFTTTPLVDAAIKGTPIFPYLHIPSYARQQRTDSRSSRQFHPPEKCFPVNRSNSDSVSDHISPYEPPRQGMFPRLQVKHLKSILRNKTYPLCKSEVNSEESIPSLVLSAASDDDDSHEISPESPTTIMSNWRQTSVGDSPRYSHQCIAFDPRVWITVFDRSKEEKLSTWYSSTEMDRFKRSAIERVRKLSNSELVPTGTSRLVRRPIHHGKALFTNPALTLDGEDDDDEHSIQRLAKSELKSVLIVDPHDICLKLFARAIKTMLPHVTIVTARSSEEATKRMLEHSRFDMVIVEERLGLFHGKGNETRLNHDVSGSSLIKVLSSAGGSDSEGGCETLWIAVSAHFETDKERMKVSGADFQWAKPPPILDQAMRDTLLKAILMKRGKVQSAFTYFGL
jgi:hypothetical protein